MRKSQCPICSVQGLPFLQAKDYNRRISTEKFLYHRCPSCGLIYLVNVPEDLGKYYPANYYAIPNDRKSLLANSAQKEYKLEIVQKFINKGRLLEIGPAWGTFACLAKQSGFDVDVIEMDKQCCDFIQNKLGIRAIQSNDPVAALERLSGYDVITLWHVIEHLPDPWALLRAAANNLAPDGIFVLAAPNPDAWQFHVMGKEWPHLDAPRHRYLLPAEVLTEYAAALGLERIHYTTTDSDAKGWNRFGWQRLLMNRVRGKWLERAAYVAGYALSLFLAPFEARDPKGSAYTLVFRKIAT